MTMLAACGDTSSSEGAETKSSGTGSLDGDGKLLVFFAQSTASPYLAAHMAGVKAEAKALGYELKVYENPVADQSKQDQMVQQFLASGEKPAAIFWWPANNEAGVNSTRLLSKVAPVIQANQVPTESGREYVKLFVGINDKVIGEQSAELLMAAREEAREKGMKLHSEGGNLLIFGFPEGYLAGDNRVAGFTDATASEPFNVLQNEPTLVTAESGFDKASQLIPKFKDEGIDFVFTLSGSLAIGVIKAFKANGFTPGKDVYISGGNCTTDLSDQENGDLYGSVMQPPALEGKLLVDAAAQYLATGEVVPGDYQYPAADEAPELELTPPHELNYIPTVVAKGAKGLTETRQWGATVGEWCAPDVN